MPITKSAKKAARQNIARRKRNVVTRENYKKSILLIKKSVKKGEKNPEILNKAYSAIDKAMKKNILHKNTAARKKSQIAKLFAKGGEQKPAKEKK